MPGIKKYPLILRTGFSLGGSGGVIINDMKELTGLLQRTHIPFSMAENREQGSMSF